MTAVHVVVPGGIDDPARPSGGNVYDRRVCRGLAALGWSVHEHAVPGSWPRPDATACATLAGVLAGVPDGDRGAGRRTGRLGGPGGAAARGGPAAARGPGAHAAGRGLAPGRRRRRAHPRRRGRCRRAAAVVTTSAWTRGWLLDHYAVGPGRVHVAEPGADPADLAPGTATGGELLCVAAVTPAKGHDVLLAALATLTDLPWRCICVGALSLDPGFVDRLARPVASRWDRRPGRFTGPRTGARARRRLRGGGPAGAGLARRDLRHGRHRGAGPRAAGRRDGGRRPAGGARPWRRQRQARPAGAAGRPGGARRRAASVADRRRAAARAAVARPGSAAPRCPAGRPPSARLSRVLAEVAA